MTYFLIIETTQKDKTMKLFLNALAQNDIHDWIAAIAIFLIFAMIASVHVYLSLELPA